MPPVEQTNHKFKHVGALNPLRSVQRQSRPELHPLKHCIPNHLTPDLTTRCLHPHGTHRRSALCLFAITACVIFILHVSQSYFFTQRIWSPFRRMLVFLKSPVTNLMASCEKAIVANAMESGDASSAVSAAGNASPLSSMQKNTPPSLFSPLLLTCSVKLDTGNYLLWRSVILPLIRGHNLEGHITDVTSCPLEFLSEDEGSKINPAFEEWIATDQLLLAWLYSTMTVGMASQMPNRNTSKELWKAAEDLSKVYAKSRIPLYMSDLRQPRKGAMKMEEYLAKMKSISDNLAFVGRPFPLDDLIARTLAGLDADYDAIVCNLALKKNLTWIDFLASLLTFENQLELCKAERSHADESGETCQLCGEDGNAADICYFRYDPNYISIEPKDY